MLPFKLVYHERYDFQLGEHVFPSQKYRLIKEHLLADGIAAAEDFVAPEPARDEDMTLAHTEDWIARLRSGRLTFKEAMLLEIPYKQEVVDAFWIATGGTILACSLALRDGVSFNVSGGFHHAFPDHGEGFCAVHDVAVGVRRMQKDRSIRRAMIVDCDVHHGNGTAAIFAGDPSVFTFSIHQLNNYPEIKPPSDVDIHLADGVQDEEYLAKLEETLLPSLDRFQPDLVAYVAGADPYREDQLGGIKLTLDGLRRREELIFGEAFRRQIPVAVVPAGGYAARVEDTVRIHCQTIESAARLRSR